MSQNRPNILYIVADQLRDDCVGCYNGYPVHTPNLDALAREGMLFEEAYTPQPLCCPARQSMISACRPERHHGLWNYDLMGVDSLTPSSDFWPAKLKEMGYNSHYFGKWHVSPDYAPTDFGYDSYISLEDYRDYREKVFGPFVRENGWFGEIDPVPLEHSRTHYLARMAEEKIKECAEQGGPWHVRVDFPEPHLPCQPCKEFWELYQDAEIPEWEGFRETFEDKPYIQKQQVYNWNGEHKEWKDWAPVAARYYAIISQVDDAIGRLIAGIKKLGEWDNTLVIVTADHGDMCGSHRMMDKHYIMYDDVVHVPLIMSWPGHIQPGSVNDDFVCHALDLGPTLMEITGGSLERTDGRSLLPLMQGHTPADWRKEVVSSYNGQQFGLYTQRMIRDKKWKYIWNTTDVDELYDMEQDKGELNNLIHDPQYKELIHSMRKRLYEVLRREGDTLIVSNWLQQQLLGEDRKL